MCLNSSDFDACLVLFGLTRFTEAFYGIDIQLDAAISGDYVLERGGRQDAFGRGEGNDSVNRVY